MRSLFEAPVLGTSCFSLRSVCGAVRGRAEWTVPGQDGTMVAALHVACVWIVWTLAQLNSAWRPRDTFTPRLSPGHSQDQEESSTLHSPETLPGFTAPVWDSLQVSGPNWEPSDFNPLLYRCSNETLYLRFPLLRHKSLQLEDGSQLLLLPERCNSSTRFYKTWFLVKLNLNGCGPKKQIEAETTLKLFYFDRLLRKHMSGEVQCEQRERGASVTCSETHVTVKIPLGARLKTVRTLGHSASEEYSVRQWRMKRVLFVEISQLKDMGSDFEVVYFDFRRKVRFVLATCSPIFPRHKVKRALKDQGIFNMWGFDDIPLQPFSHNVPLTKTKVNLRSRTTTSTTGIPHTRHARLNNLWGFREIPKGPYKGKDELALTTTRATRRTNRRRILKNKNYRRNGRLYNMWGFSTTPDKPYKGMVSAPSTTLLPTSTTRKENFGQDTKYTSYTTASSRNIKGCETFATRVTRVWDSRQRARLYNMWGFDKIPNNNMEKDTTQVTSDTPRSTILTTSSTKNGQRYSGCDKITSSILSQSTKAVLTTSMRPIFLNGVSQASTQSSGDTRVNGGWIYGPCKINMASTATSYPQLLSNGPATAMGSANELTGQYEKPIKLFEGKREAVKMTTRNSFPTTTTTGASLAYNPATYLCVTQTKTTTASTKPPPFKLTNTSSTTTLSKILQALTTMGVTNSHESTDRTTTTNMASMSTSAPSMFTSTASTTLRPNLTMPTRTRTSKMMDIIGKIQSTTRGVSTNIGAASLAVSKTSNYSMLDQIKSSSTITSLDIIKSQISNSAHRKPMQVLSTNKTSMSNVSQAIPATSSFVSTISTTAFSANYDGVTITKTAVPYSVTTTSSTTDSAMTYTTNPIPASTSSNAILSTTKVAHTNAQTSESPVQAKVIVKTASSTVSGAILYTTPRTEATNPSQNPTTFRLTTSGVSYTNAQTRESPVLAEPTVKTVSSSVSGAVPYTTSRTEVTRSSQASSVMSNTMSSASKMAYTNAKARKSVFSAIPYTTLTTDITTTTSTTSEVTDTNAQTKKSPVDAKSKIETPIKNGIPYTVLRMDLTTQRQASTILTTNAPTSESPGLADSIAKTESLTVSGAILYTTSRTEAAKPSQASTLLNAILGTNEVAYTDAQTSESAVYADAKTVSSTMSGAFPYTTSRTEVTRPSQSFLTDLNTKLTREGAYTNAQTSEIPAHAKSTVKAESSTVSGAVPSTISRTEVLGSSQASSTMSDMSATSELAYTNAQTSESPVLADATVKMLSSTISGATPYTTSRTEVPKSSQATATSNTSLSTSEMPYTNAQTKESPVLADTTVKTASSTLSGVIPYTISSTEVTRPNEASAMPSAILSSSEMAYTNAQSSQSPFMAESNIKTASSTVSGAISYTTSRTEEPRPSKTSSTMPDSIFNTREVVYTNAQTRESPVIADSTEKTESSTVSGAIPYTTTRQGLFSPAHGSPMPNPKWTNSELSTSNTSLQPKTSATKGEAPMTTTITSTPSTSSTPATASTTKDAKSKELFDDMSYDYWWGDVEIYDDSLNEKDTAARPTTTADKIFTRETIIQNMDTPILTSSTSRPSTISTTSREHFHLRAFAKTTTTTTLSTPSVDKLDTNEAFTTSTASTPASKINPLTKNTLTKLFSVISVLASKSVTSTTNNSASSKATTFVPSLTRATTNPASPTSASNVSFSSSFTPSASTKTASFTTTRASIVHSQKLIANVASTRASAIPTMKSSTSTLDTATTALPSTTDNSDFQATTTSSTIALTNSTGTAFATIDKKAITTPKHTTMNMDSSISTSAATSILSFLTNLASKTSAFSSTIGATSAIRAFPSTGTASATTSAASVTTTSTTTDNVPLRTFKSNAKESINVESASSSTAFLSTSKGSFFNTKRGWISRTSGSPSSASASTKTTRQIDSTVRASSASTIISSYTTPQGATIGQDKLSTLSVVSSIYTLNYTNAQIQPKKAAVATMGAASVTTWTSRSNVKESINIESASSATAFLSTTKESSLNTEFGLASSTSSPTLNIMHNSVTQDSKTSVTSASKIIFSIISPPSKTTKTIRMTAKRATFPITTTFPKTLLSTTNAATFHIHSSNVGTNSGETSVTEEMNIKTSVTPIKGSITTLAQGHSRTTVDPGYTTFTMDKDASSSSVNLKTSTSNAPSPNTMYTSVTRLPGSSLISTSDFTSSSLYSAINPSSPTTTRGFTPSKKFRATSDTSSASTMKLAILILNTLALPLTTDDATFRTTTAASLPVTSSRNSSSAGVAPATTSAAPVTINNTAFTYTNPVPTMTTLFATEDKKLTRSQVTIGTKTAPLTNLTTRKAFANTGVASATMSAASVTSSFANMVPSRTKTFERKGISILLATNSVFTLTTSRTPSTTSGLNSASNTLFLKSNGSASPSARSQLATLKNSTSATTIAASTANATIATTNLVPTITGVFVTKVIPKIVSTLKPNRITSNIDSTKSKPTTIPSSSTNMSSNTDAFSTAIGAAPNTTLTKVSTASQDSALNKADASYETTTDSVIMALRSSASVAKTFGRPATTSPIPTRKVKYFGQLHWQFEPTINVKSVTSSPTTRSSPTSMNPGFLSTTSEMASLTLSLNSEASVSNTIAPVGLLSKASVKPTGFIVSEQKTRAPPETNRSVSVTILATTLRNAENQVPTRITNSILTSGSASNFPAPEASPLSKITIGTESTAKVEGAPKIAMVDPTTIIGSSSTTYPASSNAVTSVEANLKKSTILATSVGLNANVSPFKATFLPSPMSTTSKVTMMTLLQLLESATKEITRPTGPNTSSTGPVSATTKATDTKATFASPSTTLSITTPTINSETLVSKTTKSPLPSANKNAVLETRTTTKSAMYSDDYGLSLFAMYDVQYDEIDTATTQEVIGKILSTPDVQTLKQAANSNATLIKLSTTTNITSTSTSAPMSTIARYASTAEIPNINASDIGLSSTNASSVATRAAPSTLGSFGPTSESNARSKSTVTSGLSSATFIAKTDSGTSRYSLTTNATLATTNATYSIIDIGIKKTTIGSTLNFTMPQRDLSMPKSTARPATLTPNAAAPQASIHLNVGAHTVYQTASTTKSKVKAYPVVNGVFSSTPYKDNSYATTRMDSTSPSKALTLSNMVLTEGKVTYTKMQPPTINLAFKETVLNITSNMTQVTTTLDSASTTTKEEINGENRWEEVEMYDKPFDKTTTDKNTSSTTKRISTATNVNVTNKSSNKSLSLNNITHAKYPITVLPTNKTMLTALPSTAKTSSSIFSATCNASTLFIRIASIKSTASNKSHSTKVLPTNKTVLTTIQSLKLTAATNASKVVSNTVYATSLLTRLASIKRTTSDITYSTRVLPTNKTMLSPMANASKVVLTTAVQNLSSSTTSKTANQNTTLYSKNPSKNSTMTRPISTTVGSVLNAMSSAHEAHETTLGSSPSATNNTATTKTAFTTTSKPPCIGGQVSINSATSTRVFPITKTMPMTSRSPSLTTLNASKSVSCTINASLLFTRLASIKSTLSKITQLTVLPTVYSSTKTTTQTAPSTATGKCTHYASTTTTTSTNNKKCGAGESHEASGTASATTSKPLTSYFSALWIVSLKSTAACTTPTKILPTTKTMQTSPTLAAATNVSRSVSSTRNATRLSVRLTTLTKQPTSKVSQSTRVLSTPETKLSTNLGKISAMSSPTGLLSDKTYTRHSLRRTTGSVTQSTTTSKCTGKLYLTSTEVPTVANKKCGDGQSQGTASSTASKTTFITISKPSSIGGQVSINSATLTRVFPITETVLMSSRSPSLTTLNASKPVSSTTNASVFFTRLASIKSTQLTKVLPTNKTMLTTTTSTADVVLTAVNYKRVSSSTLNNTAYTNPVLSKTTRIATSSPVTRKCKIDATLNRDPTTTMKSSISNNKCGGLVGQDAASVTRSAATLTTTNAFSLTRTGSTIECVMKTEDPTTTKRASTSMEATS